MSDVSLKQRVAQVLAVEIGPALELDGSQIEVLDTTDGVVRLKLGAVCSGCPSTIMLVVRGIEEELRRRLPEVEYVEATV